MGEHFRRICMWKDCIKSVENPENPIVYYYFVICLQS